MRIIDTIQITHSIRLPEWNEQVKQKIMAFWHKRGIVFSQTNGDVLKGRRGSRWGNLTSFDMSKLRADLTITKTGPGDIGCVLDVNTRYQDITEWNEAYWRLEMDTLENYLLHDDQREEEWRQFRGASRAAAWQWSLSFTRLGRRLPPKH